MSYDPGHVLRLVRAWGVAPRLVNGRLFVQTVPGDASNDYVGIARTHKAAIVAALEREADAQQREADLKATAAAILRLTDDERDQLRREIEATPADDPHLAFDRDAFQRAEWLKDLNDDTEAA